MHDTFFFTATISQAIVWPTHVPLLLTLSVTSFLSLDSTSDQHTLPDQNDSYNDDYETEKVKVHYFRYLGRTAIGKSSLFPFPWDDHQGLKGFSIILKLLTLVLAPGLKRIAVTLRLRRPRKQTTASNNSHLTSTHASLTPPIQSQYSQLSNESANAPSKSLIRHLIDLYYQYASFMFPWESKSTILSDMEEDAASACLIYCMCAIGARYVN